MASYRLHTCRTLAQIKLLVSNYILVPSTAENVFRPINEEGYVCWGGVQYNTYAWVAVKIVKRYPIPIKGEGIFDGAYLYEIPRIGLLLYGEN